EAHGEPFLRLSAVFAFPGLTYDFSRNVVAEPVLNLPELLDRTDVGLLVEFAQGRRPRVLTRVDAALRHLPGMGRVDVLRAVAALADKGAAGRIEHHEADAGPIGKGLVGGHGSDRRTRSRNRGPLLQSAFFGALSSGLRPSGSARFRLGHDRGDRHQRDPVAFRRLCPTYDALDRGAQAQDPPRARWGIPM